MKTDTRMILAPLAALAVAFGAQAFSPQAEDFESYTVGEGVGGTGKFCFVAPVGVYDESTVQAADNNKYLQVSVEEGALFRSINDPSNGNVGADATVGPAGIDIEMSMKFTVTAAGDEPEYSADDKLALWLQDEGSETNLMARGGLYTGSAGSYVLTPGTGTVYKLTGVTVTPGVWTSVKLKAIADIGGEGIPGFEVWVGETRATVTLADGLSAQVANTAVPSMSSSATLAAVGFSGEGAVDGIAITDNIPNDVTFNLAAGVTSSYDGGVYTFMSPAGYVFDSFTVNGTPVTAAAGEGIYTWNYASGATVAVTVRRYIAQDPWYKCPNAVVLAESLPKETNNGDRVVSAFHGQGEGEYLGLTYGTSPKQFDLFEVDGTNALNTVTNVAAADLTTPGLRGVVVSKALGIAMTLAYAKTTTMYAFPLDGGAPTAVVKPDTHSFDAGAFSPDGEYFFSNALNGETGNTNYVKWAVSVENGVVTLTRVGNIAAGGRGRHMAYARIKGRDLVFAMADTGLVDVIDMTGDDTSAWSKVNLLSGLPAHSYGSLCVSGVKANAPHLTVATSTNNGETKVDVLNVYELTVPASGAVTASLVKSFDEDAMTAYGFGDISDDNRYGNTVYVTDDEKTIYFARPDCKLYAAEYYAVASVDGTLYSKFESAVAAIAAGNTTDDYVTLLDNASTTMAVGDTLKVKKNGHTLTTSSASDVLLSDTTDANGVTTYTAIAGVAAVYDDNNAWVWFASFADAFTYARAQSYQPKMKFKVGSDFTPAISSDFGVWMLEFIATTDDPITINLANGNAKLVSAYITFPTTATLNAVSGDVNTMSGGTLNVPEDVRIVLNVNPYNFNTITGLTGTGTIVVPDNTVSGHSWAYWLAVSADQNRPFAALIRNSDWHGVIELTGGCDWDIELSKIGNANSKVRFNGFTTMMYGSGHGDVGVEIAGSGLSITGLYDSARTYAVGGAITGSGPLTLEDNTGSLLLSGDTSGFTGSVTASGTSASITFGAATTGSGQRIVIQSGKTATIGEGATWTAANLVLLGELTVNGTLAVNDSCIWCNNGAGVLRYANKDTLPTSKKVAGSWNSKCIIACDPGNKRFVLNDFGNANSTLEIAGDNGVFSALPSTDNTAGTAPSINPAVILTANWTVSDGWAAADKVTTFSKLSGSGNLTVNGSGNGTAAIYYTITELDNYTGTLGGARGNFTIDKVNVATPPAEGARVVATAIGANGSINSDIPLWVGGADSGDVLEYKADGAEGAGLYVKAASVVIPVVSPGTNTTYECGSAENAAAAAAAMNGADKADYIKAPAAAGIEDGSAAASTYASYFTASAVGSTVVLELNESGTNALETAATNVTAQVAGQLSTIAATSEATTVTVTGVQPGFYYTVVYDDNLATLDTAGAESTPAVAGAAGSVTLNIPAKEPSATAGFYRVKVYATDPTSN